MKMPIRCETLLDNEQPLHGYGTLCRVGVIFPAINRWAITGCPSGARQVTPALPKSRTSAHESAAQITAVTAMTIMSESECRRPCARRGSGSFPK